MTSDLLEKILNPITPASPCGDNIRYNQHQADYFKAKDLRRQARDIERANMTDETQQNPMALWHQLQQACLSLSSVTKDIEIISWLTESLIRTDQLAGLNQGFELLIELFTQYPGHLQPQYDNEPTASIVQPLTYLNGLTKDGTLIGPIGNIPITQSQQFDQYRQWQYHLAVTDKDQALSDKIKTSCEDTHDSFYSKLISDIKTSEQRFSTLTELLDNLYSKDSPPSSNIKNSLNRLHDSVKHLLGPRYAAILNNSNAIPAMLASDDSNQQMNQNNLTDKTPLNREKALLQLEQIAQFFSQTEPHSPAPYLLRRAIQWSHMDLQQLLSEIVSDDNSRHHIFELTGISATQ